MRDEPMSLLLCVVVASYLALAGVAYALRAVISGPYRDPEMAKRGDSVVLPMHARMFFAWALQPLWRAVVWSGLPATAVTTLALLLSLGAGVAVAADQLALGGWLYLSAGICDVLDGKIARHAGTASKRGAAVDSTLDRYSDAAFLAGAVWLFRGSWLLLFPLLALTGSFLVSYVRARGEGLGVTVKLGLMQRAERVVVLGVAFAVAPVVERFAPSVSATTLVVATVACVAVMTHITALRRLAYLSRMLDRQPRHVATNWKRLAPAAISALVATGADFGLVMFLVGVLSAPASAATGAGCLLGGLINFVMNRLWTFESRDRPAPQALRYAIVSGTSAMLNSAGVALVLLFPLPDYRIAWLLVRGVVFLCWNFPLQRDYVYRSTDGDPRPALDVPVHSDAPSQPHLSG